MRVLIVGTGSVGKRHARNLKELGCEIGCVDPREDRQHELDSEFDVVAHYPTLTQALDTKWDGAVISSPPAFHLEQALLCNDSKIPFLMEKNLCLVEDDFVDFHKRITVPALMGYTWRFCKSLDTFFEDVLPLAGQIRQIELTMAAHLADWHPWEPVEEFYAAERGGIVNEAHWHDIMLWKWGWPKKVFASIDHISDLNIPSADVLDSLFWYDGFRVNMHYDLYTRPHKRFIRVIGEQGTAAWAVHNTHVLQFCRDQVYDFKVNKDGEVDYRNYMNQNMPEDRNFMFMEEAKHFLEVVKGAEPICTLKDGVDVMRLLKISNISSASDKAWI
jgi:predicted dehydrogenase